MWSRNFRKTSIILTQRIIRLVYWCCIYVRPVCAFIACYVCSITWRLTRIHICDLACKNRLSEHNKLLIFLSLLYHNLTIYATETKFLSLLQNLIGILLQLTEMRYYILNRRYYQIYNSCAHMVDFCRPGHTYCISLNYSLGISFLQATFNQATKPERHLLVEDSCAVYNLWC